MAVTFLFPALVWSLLGVYLYHIIVRFFTLLHIREKTSASRILSLAVTLFCVSRGWMLYGLGAVIILHFLAFSAGMEVVWRIGKKRICKEKAKKAFRIIWCAPRQVDSEKNISFSASWFYQLAVFLCCL